MNEMTKYPSLKSLCQSCGACCCNGNLFDYVMIFLSEEKLVRKLTKLGVKFTKDSNGWSMNVEKGCPLLKNNRCSIYNDRPIACKTFDCRESLKLMNEIHGL